MALNRWGVGFLVSARDHASRVFGRVGSSFGRLTKQVVSGARRQEVAMRSVAIGGAMTVAAAGILGGISSVTNAAGKFEQGMAGIGAVTKATRQEMDALRDSAIEAGIKTQFSPDEAREGLLSLATAGQTATEATKTLLPVLDLAASSLGQLGVGEAASAVVGTLKSYGMQVGEATGVTDKLLRITQLTNFQARDFEAGLAKAAAAAGVFDQSLDDTLITMGQLRNANIDASTASTAFREATRRLGSDSGVQQKLQQKGIDVFDKQTGKMRSVVDIMVDMDKKTQKLKDSERKRIVTQSLGARGLLAFNAISKATFTTMRDGEQVVLKGKEAIEALRMEMSKAEGTAKKMKDALLDTFEGQKTLLSGTLRTFAIELGAPLAKALKPLLKGVVNALNSLLRFFKNLPEPVKKGIMSFVALAGAITGIIGGAMLLKGVLSLLGFSFSSLLITFGQLLVIGPAILLLVGGLGVASYAAYRAFQKNTGGISDSWQDMVRKVTLAFKAMKQMLFDVEFSKEVRAELEKAENKGVMKFLSAFRVFVERMKMFWVGLKVGFEKGVDALANSSAMKRLLKVLESVFGMFTGPESKNSVDAMNKWGKEGVKTGEKLAKLGEIALGAIETIVDLGRQIMQFVSQLTADDVAGGIEQITETFKGLWTTLKSIVEVAGWIADAIRVVVNLFQVAGAFIAETLGAFIKVHTTAFQTGKKILKGDFTGAVGEVKKFIDTPIYEETVAQSGDVVRVFDPTSRIGLEKEERGRFEGIGSGKDDRGKFEKNAVQQLMQQRREAAVILQQRRASGGDTEDVVNLLRELNSTILEISKRPPPPLKVTIDADQVASSTREANQRDRERSVDESAAPAFF